MKKIGYLKIPAGRLSTSHSGMFLPGGFDWHASSHWSTSITIKLQTLCAQFAPVCSSVCEVVSLWLTHQKFSSSLPVSASRAEQSGAQRHKLQASSGLLGAPAISIERDKVRDGGGKVDKSGCSRGWREKWLGEEMNSWSWSRNKSTIQELLCELGNFFKVRSPISLSVCSAAPLSACFLSFSQSLTDAPFTSIYVFYLISLVSLLHFFPHPHTHSLTHTYTPPPIASKCPL